LSESPYKRRLRSRKRAITTTLTREGYRVTPCDGTFHLFAEKGQALRKIRLTFAYPEKGDIVSVALEPAPRRGQREVWYIDERGQVALRLMVEGIIPPIDIK